ncbi:MAG: TraB/GumN family protein [Myxococcota bacterium]
MSNGVRVRGWSLLLLLAWLFACATPLPPAPDSAQSGYRYENRRLGIAVGLPDDWAGFATRAEAPPGFEALIPRSKRRDDSPLMVGVDAGRQAFVRLLVEKVPLGTTAEEYFGRLHLGLSDEVETLEVAGARGRDTVRWRYRGRQGALEMIFVEFVTVADSRAFRLGFWSVAALAERRAEEFAQIAADVFVHRNDQWSAPWRELEPLLDGSAYAHMEFAEDSAPRGPPDCPAGDEPALWTVDAPGVTLHLFGSIHYGHPAFYPLSDAIEAAFAESDVLVVEIDFNAPGADAEMAEASKVLMLPAGTTLDEVISPDLYAETVKVLDSLGIAPANVSQVGPTLLASTLALVKAMTIGYDAQLGVDRYFLDRAGDREVMALESPASQMAMLAELDGEQVLAETISSIEKMDEQSQMMVAAWRCGYEDDLASALFPVGIELDPQAAEMYRKIFSERNVSMTRDLLPLFERGGTYFVVTGAGHMLGADGIPELLRAEGYTVERR